MKKFTLLFSVIATIGTFSSLSAQDVFDKGSTVMQATIGFPQLLGRGSVYNTSIPAVALAGDYCIIDGLIDGNASVGVGGLLGLAGSKTTYGAGTGAYGYKYTYILFGARGTFHYQLLDQLDTYAGVIIGGYGVNSKYYGPTGSTAFVGADSGGPIFGGFVGVRYYLSDNFAVLSELGYGIAVLNVGVGLRF